MATMAVRRWAGLCAAGVLAVAGTAGSLVAAAPQDAGATATLPSKPAPIGAQVTLDGRDLDLRVAYTLLFNAFGQDYGIEPAAQGYVTLKLTQQPLEVALKQVTRAAPIPLTIEQENNMWMVRSAPDAAKAQPGRRARQASPTTPGEYRGWKQVPRRMAGYLSVGERKWAVLVNGPEADPQAQTRVVRVGDLVPAGFRGHKPLRVTQIAEKGLVLALGANKNDQIVVPLRQSYIPPVAEPKY